MFAAKSFFATAGPLNVVIREIDLFSLVVVSIPLLMFEVNRRSVTLSPAARPRSSTLFPATPVFEGRGDVGPSLSRVAWREAVACGTSGKARMGKRSILSTSALNAIGSGRYLFLGLQATRGRDDTGVNLKQERSPSLESQRGCMCFAHLFFLFLAFMSAESHPHPVVL